MKRAKAYSVSWMHDSYLRPGCLMNKQAGYAKNNIGWVKRCHRLPGVFRMGVFHGPSDELVGWSMYQKTTSGIEILWMIVDEKHRRNGIGEIMLERLQGWMQSIPNRRGALTINVHEYADDILCMLSKHGFQTLKIDAVRQSYRMIWLGESKKETVG